MQSKVYNLYNFNFKNNVLDRFKKLCGFFDNCNTEIERKKEALIYFEKNFRCLDVQSIYSYLDKKIFENLKINVEKDILKLFLLSNVFSFIFFAVTVSEIKRADKSNILKEFYFDILGTAIIDTARNMLKNKFYEVYKKKFVNCFVSDSFGIGFFGIDNEDIFKFFSILECSKIGLKLKKNGVMSPNKSFIGFFTLSEKPLYIKNSCKNCSGTKENCFFCKNKK